MGPEGKEDVDSLKTTKIALGIKFSIIRPKWSTATKTAYENLIAVQKELLEQFKKNEKQHASYIVYAKKREELRAVNRDTTISAVEKAIRLAQLAHVIDSLEVLINDDTNNQLSTNTSTSYLAVQKQPPALNPKDKVSSSISPAVFHSTFPTTALTIVTFKKQEPG